MLFTEFNMEDALEVRGEERYEDGLEDGRKQGLQAGLEDGRRQGLQAGLEDGRRLGHSEGEADGQARIQKLMGYLLDAKRYPDLEKASKDTAYLNLLCREYGI